MEDNVVYVELEPLDCTSHRALEIDPDLARVTLASPAGCFRFDDGTTQNWSLNQIYANGAKLTPAAGSLGTFSLANSASLALEASASPFLVQDAVNEGDIYLESPTLLQNPAWQQIAGFSLDLHAFFSSSVFGLPPSGPYRAQLQMKLIDTNGAPHLFVEVDATGNPVEHPVSNNAPHHFAWKAQEITAALAAGQKVLQVRVKLTTPHIASLEKGVHARWLIGNVCPEN